MELQLVTWMIDVAVGKEYDGWKVGSIFFFTPKWCLQRQILFCAIIFSGTEQMFTCKTFKWYTHKSRRSLDHNFMIQIEFSVRNIIRKKALC